MILSYSVKITVKEGVKMNNNPIGFLDSGIGGVTVLREAVKLLPNENYFFFSDSAHNPYGDKTDEEIIARCDEIVSLMLQKIARQLSLRATPLRQRRGVF